MTGEPVETAKEPMLANAPEKKGNGTIVAKKTLDEVGSLRLEVSMLQSQNLDLSRQLVRSQETMITLQKENLLLREKNLKSEHDQLFAKLGIGGGNFAVSKNSQGLYEVAPQTEESK